MAEKTLKLEIPLLLPELPDDRDSCLEQLEHLLTGRRGILRVHLEREQDPVRLCLHYDPNLITLPAVEQVARQVGSEFSQRYRHQTIPFARMDAADAAANLAQVLEQLPGMLHARVNYAAGLIYVAYDTELLDLSTIEQTIRRMGHRLARPPERTATEPEHDHGSAPLFLPHWMQERWPLLLVGLAGVFFLIGWIGEQWADLPASVALVFYVLAYLAGGYDVATHAIPGLLKGKFDTDVLMLAAATGAALLGEWSEGAFLLFLFALGHAGEHYALDRARNAVNALGQLMPQSAQVKRGEQIVTEPVNSLQLDDVVVVRPGDRLPVDGQIVKGQSAIDQSPITGESVPVTRSEGDEVFAGTINQTAALEIRVSRLAQDNTLSRVMRLVAEAQSQQSPTQQFTQRFTARFVPAVLLFVALVIVVPPLVGWMSWSDSFYRAMLLLVAASPCALALGTPAAVLAGVAQAARNGVLIKGGVHLENLGRLNVMAFDKTGTLTEGNFKVTDIEPLNGTDSTELLRVAAAVEQQSNHPLALAVVRTAQEKGLELPVAQGLENVSGRGVKSEINGQPVLIGSLKLFRETEGHPLDDTVIQTVARFEDQGKSTMAVSQSGRFLGVLALADMPRPGVKKTLQKLLDLGIRQLVMLTGDNRHYR